MMGSSAGWANVVPLDSWICVDEELVKSTNSASCTALSEVRGGRPPPKLTFFFTFSAGFGVGELVAVNIGATGAIHPSFRTGLLVMR
jgi:hypothetical protein